MNQHQTTDSMKAIGLTRYLPIANSDSLQDVELPKPVPQGRDLLIEIKAIAVNPVDVKVRAPKDKIEAAPRVLGWDAAGVVIAVGADVSGFKVGDQVFYAGDITRPGCNSAFQLVDERLVGHAPATLSFEQAAALPLTTITAWEALFERLSVPRKGAAGKPASILIIGGAGGVGSIAIQLAVQLTDLQVIATASRPQSEQWVRDLGAHHVINHFGDMPAQIKQLGLADGGSVEYVLILNDTDRHFPAAAEMVAPQGTIATIVENAGPLDVSLLKAKSAGFVWEFMFTRSMFQTADMAEQGRLLDEVARLIDQGVLKTTVNKVLSPINAANLRLAHADLEEGRVIGKIVLKDF